MFGHLLDFSPRGWGRVWLWTGLGTLFCVAAALYVDSFNFSSLDAAALERAIVTDVLLPIMLAGPLLFFFSARLRDLSIAHHDLEILAATDSLTGLFNRRAFTDRVEAALQALSQTTSPPSGALLVLDVDNFKAINDRFGHDQGDAALRIIAGAIGATLQSGDLLGRIGGEEFGIFLPQASQAESQATAEAVRQAVVNARFSPEDMPTCLSVSIGVATYARTPRFDQLFRTADQQLYRAKQNGRNRVAISPVELPLRPLAA